MIERIIIGFIILMVNRRMDLMEMLEPWFQFDRQKSIEENVITHRVKQQILPRDQYLKFKSNRYFLSVFSSYSFKS